MSGFTLDTSGCVAVPYGSRFIGDRAFWPDLDAFTQGYIEAAFAEFLAYDIGHHPHFFKKGFSDLAPETLAAILKDCAARLRHCPSEGVYPFRYHSQEALRWIQSNGKRFWRWRQDGGCKNFPPLTVYLDDDGKVYLREAA